MEVVDASLEKDFELFGDHARLAEGVALTEKNTDVGKIIFWLGDLPQKVVFLTERKNTIERISSYEVLIGGKKLIFIPSSNKTVVEKSKSNSSLGIPGLSLPNSLNFLNINIPLNILPSFPNSTLQTNPLTANTSTLTSQPSSAGIPLGEMYGLQRFYVSHPKEIEGYYDCKFATFCPYPSPLLPLEAKLVQVNPPGCIDKITNAADLMGNIALVDRGGGAFWKKVQNCKNVGVKGVMISNDSDIMIQMGAPDEFKCPIVAVTITKSTRDIFRKHLPNVHIKFSNPGSATSVPFNTQPIFSPIPPPSILSSPSNPESVSRPNQEQYTQEDNKQQPQQEAQEEDDILIVNDDDDDDPFDPSEHNMEPHDVSSKNDDIW